MLTNHKNSVLTSMLVAVLCACGGSGEDYGPDDTSPTVPDPIPNIAPVQEPTALTCPKGSSLTYENFGESFMLKYCTSCHSQHVPEGQRAGAPVAANFDTPADVSLWRAAILKTTGTTPIIVQPNDGIADGTADGGTTDDGTTDDATDPNDPGTFLAEAETDENDGVAPIPVATMPPGGGISASDKASLAEWLRCGAPGTRDRLD